MVNEKLDKYPFKARFISVALESSVKPLSKAATAVVKLFHKQIET